MPAQYVLWFNEVDKHDIDKVGGKGANLGEMTKAGFPVPNGFIVTAQAYYRFLDEAKIREKIRSLLGNLDVSDSKALEKAANSVQQLIIRSRFPKDIADDIIRAYFKLSGHAFKHALVAVRSSATAEDLPNASFAGQQSTFLNVKGEANVILKVREAWASLFTARAIFYRQTNKFDHFKVGIAVPVQKMVSSDISGIMFTIDPVINDKSKIIIEAIIGLGEMIVQGAVTPDHYEVDKKKGTILGKQINYQEKQMIKKGNGNSIQKLSKAKGSKQKLSDKQVEAVASLGKKLEQHYYFPQDVEWAIERGSVYLVQTRPVTTTGKKAGAGSSTDDVFLGKIVYIQGDPASPGIACGPVKVIRSVKEIHKIVPGDVLVAEQTNPDYVPAMRKAVGIVTERGGRTSHAAIVSRELGIPAIVGAPNAMKLLKDGLVITINGTKGTVYKGAIHQPPKVLAYPKDEGEEASAKRNIKTATKIYVNLAEAQRAKEVAKMNVDGVGLLRAEFMIAEVGKHPKKLIAEGKQHLFVSTLTKRIEEFCEAFDPRPVIYRATDFKTNEYRNLTGGKAYEPVEPNPMLGFRGAARYVANPDVFELELEAIKTVRHKLNYKNLHLMIPFVRTPKELLEVKKIVAGSGLLRTPSFKLYLMVEIPTNVIRLTDFLEVGVDGISIGSNDLTMLMLGTDRDNSEVAHDFSELDPSVLWVLEKAIRTCGDHGVTSSICGQAPSDYPELVEKLVSWGITSISVNPDAIERVRETVYGVEQKIMRTKRK